MLMWFGNYNLDENQKKRKKAEPAQKKTNDTEQHQIDEELSSNAELLNISKEVKKIKDGQF